MYTYISTRIIGALFCQGNSFGRGIQVFKKNYKDRGTEQLKQHI